MEEFIAKKIEKRGKLLHLLTLGRPWNGLLLILSFFLGASLVGFANPLSTVLGASVFLFLYMAGTTLNDIFDFNEDSINMPYRPLQKKIIKIKEAYIFSIFLYLLGLSIAFVLGPLFLFISSLFVILSIAYSVEPVKLVKRGIFGNTVLAIVSIFLPSMGGTIVNSSPPQLTILAIVCLTIFFLGVSLFKDFKDLVGDSEHNKITPAVKFGIKRTTYLGVFKSTLFFILFITAIIFLKRNIFLILLAVLLIPIVNIKTNKKYSKNESSRFTHLRLILLPTLIIIIIALSITP